jgi:ATP:ADP antiporter, AAA family
VNRTLTRVAMATAAIMIGHQVGAKAFRDAAFLTAWPATALPMMTLGTAALTGVLVPIFSRFLDRFSPLTVVAAGFALSAAGHAAEWAFYDASRAVVVIIYLHLAGVGVVLLSGFWSLLAERFDPASARAAYGRIAAAGTAGGMFGSLAAERIATLVRPEAVLILLTILHVLCAGGVLMLRSSPTLLPREPDLDGSVSGLRETFRAPYLRTIATFVVLTSASSAIVDFLLKSQVTASLGGGPGLMRFFAIFYAMVQVLTFVAQTSSGTLVQRLGISGTLNALPGGVGAVSMASLLIQGWPMATALRGADAVLRGSLFRSGYELLFVPMDARTRRRAKTILDVICDRAGEAAGAGLVQLFLLASIASIASSLLAAVFVLAVASFWVGQRFASLYLGVVEHQLLKYRDTAAVSLVSEAGWTILQPPLDSALVRSTADASAAAAPAAAPATPRLDQQLEMLAQLRSRRPADVVSALARSSTFARMHVAQCIDLLAWDDVLPAARTALEQLAPVHLGMMTDALLDQSTDFAIRRRLPRILGTVASLRSLEGVANGLDDPRFEVRYHCCRAIIRILARNQELAVDRARMISVVERELSVPPQVWRGYRLLDRPEVEDAADAGEPVEASSRQVEYIFMLLSTIVAREPLSAAVHGIRSSNPGVRGLAIEYLDQVLPAAVLERLRAMIASIPSGGDAPSQSD